MRPLRRCIMWPATAFEQRNVPFTLTSMMRSQSSSANMATGPTLMTPALLTRMSTWPQRSIAALHHRLALREVAHVDVDGDRVAAELA